MIFSWEEDVQEVQNRAVKKEVLDVTSMTMDELLDQFHTSIWKHHSPELRIGIIQEMENRNASEQGRIPAKVVSSEDLAMYGSYNDIHNVININVSNFSSYDVLDTYIHESTHAYQTYCVGDSIGYDAHVLNMMAVEFMRDQNGYLYNYEPGNEMACSGYDIQCSELDSNNRALLFMLSQHGRFEQDREYKDYISGRAEHFKTVNEFIKENQNMRVSMQNNQAYRSYVRGDISEKQYTEMINNINNVQYMDQTVKQNAFIANMVKELNNSYAAQNENTVQNKEYSLDEENSIQGKVEAACELEGIGDREDTGGLDDEGGLDM